MQTVKNIEEVLAATLTVLNETHCSNQCIAGSAIVLQVLQREGYSLAYPLTVRVEIASMAQPSTGIVLGKGTTAGPGQWPGHLVVIVPNYDGNDHLLIDLTVVQVNGKVPGIELTPFVGLVGDDFINGHKPAHCVERGCQLAYFAYPDDDSYRVETNWSSVPGVDGAVQMVIERLAE